MERRARRRAAPEVLLLLVEVGGSGWPDSSKRVGRLGRMQIILPSRRRQRMMLPSLLAVKSHLASEEATAQVTLSLCPRTANKFESVEKLSVCVDGETIRSPKKRWILPLCSATSFCSRAAMMSLSACAASASPKVGASSDSKKSSPSFATPAALEEERPWRYIFASLTLASAGVSAASASSSLSTPRS